MKLVITGGCGYVGSALSQHLREAGHDVTTVDIVGAADKIADYRELPAGFYDRFEAIVHLAAYSSVSACAAKPWEATYLNLISFLKTLRKFGGQPLLWASSASVLSPVGGNVYDATKRAAEAMVPALYPNSYALRFGTVCGFSPKMRWDLMLNKMTSDAQTDGIVYVSSPGIYRPVLAMRDLRNAIERLLAGGDNRPGQYNLCSFNGMVGAMAADVAKRFRAETRDLRATSAPYDFCMTTSRIDGWGALETVDTILDDLEAAMAHRA